MRLDSKEFGVNYHLLVYEDGWSVFSKDYFCFMTAKETKGVYFSELRLENVKCFREPVTLNFLNEDKSDWRRWTVILGDNGVGKTTLLQALASFEMYSRRGIPTGQSVLGFRDYGMDNFLFKTGGGIFANTFGNSHSGSNTTSEYTLQKFCERGDLVLDAFSTSGTLKDALILHDKVDESVGEKLVIFSYGGNRIMSKSSLGDDFFLKNAATLFDDEAVLINAEEWLLRLDYAASKESDLKESAAKKREQIKDTLRELLPDIHEIKILDPTKDQLTPSVSFNTDFGWLNIHELSLGYRSMIAWVIDLAARMYARYPDSDNPLSEPAIVLVDEIDLHLHPKWQRNIFKYLSERFPATQFIVTAHSPLIVQSAPEDVNLVVLRKNGNTVVIDQEIENVRKWRIDQILTSDLFGLDSARSPEIEAKMKERVALVKKGKLSVDEEKRLKELDELAYSLPTADSASDIEAMEIIRKAAAYLKEKKDTEL